MIVYQTDPSGRFVGTVTADEDPRQPGGYLIPGGCVAVAPPEIPDGYIAVFDGTGWSVTLRPDEELRALAEPVAPPTDPTRIVTGWHPDIAEGRVVQVWDSRPETEAEGKARLNAPILAALAALDTATVRPLRSVLAAQASGKTPDPTDIARLADLEAEAARLRGRLVA